MDFCKVPDLAIRSANSRICHWPRGQKVTWTLAMGVGRFSRDQLVDIYRAAWSSWESVCGIRTEYVSSTTSANVVVTARSIDGDGGILAEAQLPCGPVNSRTQLGVWFDLSEEWILAQAMPNQMVDLLRVAAHEFGHSIGIGHAPRSSNNLMAPTVSQIRQPQDWDIAEAARRYGPPKGVDEGRFDREVFAAGFKDGRLQVYLEGKPIGT